MTKQFSHPDLGTFEAIDPVTQGPGEDFYEALVEKGLNSKDHSEFWNDRVIVETAVKTGVLLDPEGKLAEPRECKPALLRFLAIETTAWVNQSRIIPKV